MKLCCEADGQLVWSKSEAALASLPFIQQDGCLTIRSLNKLNAGKYTCRATNQFGISEATSQLILTGDHLLSFSAVICFSFVKFTHCLVPQNIIT